METIECHQSKGKEAKAKLEGKLQGLDQLSNLNKFFRNREEKLQARTLHGKEQSARWKKKKKKKKKNGRRGDEGHVPEDRL